MTLDDLIRLAGTDPAKIELMSESELRIYLSPLFPETRPSAERQAIVQKQAQKQTLVKHMSAMDNLAKMLASVPQKKT